MEGLVHTGKGLPPGGGVLLPQVCTVQEHYTSQQAIPVCCVHEDMTGTCLIVYKRLMQPVPEQLTSQGCSGSVKDTPPPPPPTFSLLDAQPGMFLAALLFRVASVFLLARLLPEMLYNVVCFVSPAGGALSGQAADTPQLGKALGFSWPWSQAHALC